MLPLSVIKFLINDPNFQKKEFTGILIINLLDIFFKLLIYFFNSLVLKCSKVPEL